MLKPATNLDQLYIACDPQEALAGGRSHDYYYDLGRGRGTRSVTEYIGRTLSLEAAAPDGHSRSCKVLLTGHVGTGKSTELNSLAAELTAMGYYVVRIWALTDLNIYDLDLGWQDLLLELAYQVYNQGTAAFENGEIGAAPSLCHPT